MGKGRVPDLQTYSPPCGRVRKLRTRHGRLPRRSADLRPRPSEISGDRLKGMTRAKHNSCTDEIARRRTPPAMALQGEKNGAPPRLAGPRRGSEHRPDENHP